MDAAPAPALRGRPCDRLGAAAAAATAGALAGAEAGGAAASGPPPWLASSALLLVSKPCTYESNSLAAAEQPVAGPAPRPAAAAPPMGALPACAGTSAVAVMLTGSQCQSASLQLAESPEREVGAYWLGPGQAGPGGARPHCAGWAAGLPCKTARTHVRSTAAVERMNCIRQKALGKQPAHTSWHTRYQRAAGTGARVPSSWPEQGP